MKIFLSLILFVTVSFVYSQDLKNTEWVKINAERKDGSKIRDVNGKDKVIENFLFKDTSVLISVNHQYISEQYYGIRNDTLSIGKFLKFSIDTVNDILLEISEIPEVPTPDSELNTYAFIKSRYLFEYLKENNKVKIIGDSIVECTEQFCPTYSKSDLLNLLDKPFNKREDTVTISGYFIINSDKEITEVHIDPSASVKEKKADEFVKMIKETGISWMLPITDKSYSFKMTFSCFFKNKFMYFTDHSLKIRDHQNMMFSINKIKLCL